MTSYKLDQMVKGWFIGAFNPTAHQTKSCEVAVKKYKAGDTEAMHFHKIATEITLVVSGRVRMVGRIWEEGDIIVLSPGEATDFEALTDAVNVVVKTPSCTTDKFIVTK